MYLETISLSKLTNPVDTGRKLNVLCKFNLRPVSTGNALTLSCEGNISEDEMFKSLKSMKEINHLETMDPRKNSLNVSRMKSEILF